MASYGTRPVPQNIMNVEFKLFDLVTVKQFLLAFALFLFCGVLVYFGRGLFWQVFVPGVSGFVGILFIFVPFNGEPFSNFISYYLEAMISPQRRVWNKKGYVVKSAFKAAQEIRFGNDPMNNSENGFKYNSDKGIKLAEAALLDEQEAAFIERKEQGVEINANIESMNSNGKSNDQNQPVLQKRVDLNQFSFIDNSEPDESRVTINDDSKDIKTLQAGSTYLQKEGGNKGVNIDFSMVSESYSNQQYVDHKKDESMPISISIQNKTQQQNTSFDERNAPSESMISNDQNKVINDSNASGNTSEKPSELQNQVDDEFENAILTDSEGYIFGIVEKNDLPIESAAVVIKKADKNLEIVYTNKNGEFKSNFEHKAGKYQLVVNHESKEIKRVDIDFDPYSSDRVEILLGNEIQNTNFKEDDSKNNFSFQEKSVENRNNQQFNNTEDITQNVKKDDVFSGDYNPNLMPPRQPTYNSKNTSPITHPSQNFSESVITNTDHSDQNLNSFHDNQSQIHSNHVHNNIQPVHNIYQPQNNPSTTVGAPQTNNPIESNQMISTSPNPGNSFFGQNNHINHDNNHINHDINSSQNFQTNQSLYPPSSVQQINNPSNNIVELHNHPVLSQSQGNNGYTFTSNPNIQDTTDNYSKQNLHSNGGQSYNENTQAQTNSYTEHQTNKSNQQLFPDTYDNHPIQNQNSNASPQVNYNQPNLNNSQFMSQPGVSQFTFSEHKIFSNQSNSSSNQNKTISNLQNYNELPITEYNLDSNLIFIPNTINGRVVSYNGSENRIVSIQNASVVIKSGDSNVVRTLSTDNNGNFYSYAPINSGLYIIEVNLNGQIKKSFFITLSGEVQKPRQVTI